MTHVNILEARNACIGRTRASMCQTMLLSSVVMLMAFFLSVSAALADVVNISPEEARQRVVDGEIILVDVRTPREWRKSGLPDVAIGIDMRRKDFVDVLKDLQAKADGRPIAYICSASGRSSSVARDLDRAGFADVINVTEGVLGNRSGPGWLERGLPMRNTGTPPHSSVDPKLVPEG